MPTDTPSPAAPGPQLSFDAATMMRYDANKRSTLVAYLLWFFLGGFAAHRFYLGRTGTAIVMLLGWLVSIVLTVVYVGLIGIVVLGLWLLVDAFLIPGMVRDYNNGLIARITSGAVV